MKLKSWSVSFTACPFSYNGGNIRLLVGGHVGFLSLFCLYFEGFAKVSSVLESYTAEDERV